MLCICTFSTTFRESIFPSAQHHHRFLGRGGRKEMPPAGDGDSGRLRLRRLNHRKLALTESRRRRKPLLQPRLMKGKGKGKEESCDTSSILAFVLSLGVERGPPPPPPPISPLGHVQSTRFVGRQRKKGPSVGFFFLKGLVTTLYIESGGWRRRDFSIQW